MAKERAINPAQAQHKLDKQKALKKGMPGVLFSFPLFPLKSPIPSTLSPFSWYFVHLMLPPPGAKKSGSKKTNTILISTTGKAEQAARRTEKLARRNPARLQRQIDELRGAEASGAALNSREKKQLEELERDLKAVLKAREALGDKAPTFGDGGGGGGGGGARPPGALGKRRRDDDDAGGGSGGGGGGGISGRSWPTRGHRGRDGTAADDSDDSSSAPESVKKIPMPRDTPPPIPAEYFAAQQRKQQQQQRRQRLQQQQQQQQKYSPPPIRQQPHPLPPRPGLQAPPAQPAQTVYEAKPVLRDLRKEATRAFVPSAVRAKLDAAKGQGKKLLEPEDADALERQGYLQGSSSGGDGGTTPLPQSPPPPPPSRRPLPTVENADSDDDNDGYGQEHGRPSTTSHYEQSSGPTGGNKVDGDEDALHLLDEEEKRFRRDIELASPMDTG
jgi:hypothetical protein